MNLQSAFAELKKASELDPKNIRLYLELAKAYLKMNDRAAAEATLQQALKAEPRSTDARVALGDFRLLTGKPEQGETE